MSKLLTTREVAKRLGISANALSRYVLLGKVFAPETVDIGHLRVHSWKEEDVERLRELLPKIANGRKTRHKKKSAPGNQQSGKPKKQTTPAGAPAPHESPKPQKPRKTKKK